MWRCPETPWSQVVGRITCTGKKVVGIVSRADTDLLKMVPVGILLNFGNYFRTQQLGF